jgi:fumarylacetoacetase
MPYILNETHNPDALSWVPAANAHDAAFPIQNLPYGVFSHTATDDPPRVGVAIGDRVLDVGMVHRLDLFTGAAYEAAERCNASSLNGLLALTPLHWSALRRRIHELLRVKHPDMRYHQRVLAPALFPLADVRLHVPFESRDFTDFYASMHHATNVGTMLRPESPLLPNYRHVPIGYHGRASSIVVSGTSVVRPSGQMLPQGRETPVFGPSQRLDYELEVGLVIGGQNAIGRPVPIGEARARVFGICLLNDWSARDVQAWEYQPLGPFLSKSFATTISPWVVTLEALTPFRSRQTPRPEDHPPLLSYLWDDEDQARGAFDVTLEVWLSSAAMREQGMAPMRVSTSSMHDLYWTPAQLIAHHTSNGCNLAPADLLGTGTVSGETPESRGCLLERTWRGTEPLVLPTGEERRFLEDGDEVTLTGRADRGGAAGIGLGTCVGRIAPPDHVSKPASGVP